MKKKWFLRILILVSFLWLSILLVFYYISANYQDYAIRYLKEYLDNQLSTEIVVKKSDIHFSLFRKFPHVAIWMDNILIKSAPGPDYHQINLPAKDTLLFARKISFVFNLTSLFTKNYELKKIEIKDAELNILLDKEKRGNYFILKQTNLKTPEDSFKVDLKKIDLRNINVCYYDASSEVIITSLIPKGDFSGTLSDKNIELQTTLNSLHTSLWVEKKEYLHDESINFQCSIINNQDNYSFRDGKLYVFGIGMNLNGEWNNQKETYKLSIFAKNESLQHIKNKYLDDFIGKVGFQPEKGSLSFKIVVAGKNNKNPHINADFLISKGIVEDKKNEIKLKDFYLKGSYTNGKASSASSSVVNIESLSAVSDQSQVLFSGSLNNFNNPFITGKINGNIELEKIGKMNSVQSKLELSGIIKIKIDFEGALPDLKSFKISSLNHLNFNSQIEFEDIYIKPLSNPFPSVKATGNISFNNLNEILLEKISLTTGKSTFVITGIVSNIPLFNDGKNLILTYNCKVNSPEFHVEDFLVRDESGRKQESGKKAEFPDSIIINTSFHAEKFSFGKFLATNVRGDINYAQKTMKIDSFSMNSQDGKISSNIEIKQDGNYFITHCNATLKQINIHSLFESLNNFGQSVIESENLAGKISGNVNVVETWDQYFNPQKEQLLLQAEYEIIDGEIINYQPLLGLARFIELEELKHIRFQRLQSTISITHRTVYFSQTDIRSSAVNLTGSGEHRFDNSYEYHFQVQLSDVLWFKAKKKKPQNDEFGYIEDDGLNQTTLPLVIKGKGTEYDVSYDKRAAGNTFKEKVKKEKDELKLLFNTDTDSLDVDGIEDEQRIDWEENSQKTPIKQYPDKKTNKPENKEEFSIQWEDD